MTSMRTIALRTRNACFALGLLLALVGLRAAPGKDAAESEAAYAQGLIAALEKAGFAHGLRYDPEHHEILSPGGRHISITNLYLEWLALPEEARDFALARAARGISTPASGTPPELDQVRDSLLPVVRHVLYFAPAESFAPLPTVAPKIFLPYTPLGADAGVGVAIDFADAISIISTVHLDHWKVALDALEQVAVANLRKRSGPFEQLEQGVWASRTRDSYDASRVLLVEDIRKLRLAGGAVALIPHRSLLLLAGAKDAKGLLSIAQRAEVVANAPQPIHMIALCLRESGWSDCLPDATPQVRARYHELALRSRVAAYEEQRKPLQEKLGEEVFVASLKMTRNNVTGELASYAEWTKTVPTLLPRAAMILFAEPSSGDKPNILGLVPWERVISVCGSRLKREGAPE